MKAWIIGVAVLASTALWGQTYAGLGFGVTTGAGIYAEHYFHPKWSLVVNAGIPAVGFGVNYVLRESPGRRLQIGALNSKEEIYRRAKNNKNAGRLTAGVTFTGAVLPDVGLFQYRFWNLGLHKTFRKTDFGMELGWMRGDIIAGPTGNTYPQPFTSPGIQFTLGRALFQPGPLRRLRQRAQNL